MQALARDSMEAWFGLLPDDVASCMEKPGQDGQAEADAIAAGLLSVGSGSDLVTYVAGNQDSFIAIGRARRIRILAWLAAGQYPDKVAALQALSGEEGAGEGGSAAGTDKVAPYFKEDIRALVEALGPRAARGIVDAATLAAVAGAGYEVAGELDMRSGGSR